jgi:hypothetical protein
MSVVPYSRADRELVRLQTRAPLLHDTVFKWLWRGHPNHLFSRPQIVTLCGSTRFVDEFNHWRQYWTLQGLIVLSIEIVTTQQREDPQHVNRPNKEMLDALHLEKIKLSDFIFVINKGGYVGDSTRAEIAFAVGNDVPVEYMEELYPVMGHE